MKIATIEQYFPRPRVRLVKVITDTGLVVAVTEAFVGAVADTIDGELPPLTLVPQPKMHSDDFTVEIWGVAKG